MADLVSQVFPARATNRTDEHEVPNEIVEMSPCSAAEPLLPLKGLGPFRAKFTDDGE